MLLSNTPLARVIKIDSHGEINKYVNTCATYKRESALNYLSLKRGKKVENVEPHVKGASFHQ